MLNNYTYRGKGKLVIFIINLFLFSSLLHAQQGFNFKNDTLKAEEYGFFSIPEIDYEIEKINNSLTRTSRKLEEINHLLDTDTSYLDLISKTNKEIKDFDSYNPHDLSKFFLENSHRIWKGYEKRLKAKQEKCFDLLTNSELRNKQLDKEEKTWEKTSENSRKYPIPETQVEKIKKIQKRINKQHNENYKLSLRIINYESIISNQLRIVEDMLIHIESLQDTYRDELFIKSDISLVKITLSESTNRHLFEGIKHAWIDNTKYITSNYHAYSESTQDFILFSFFLLLFHFLLRKKYFQKFGDTRKTKAKDIKFVLFQNPITSALSTVLFVFFIIYENIPLALSGFISLILLISIYLSMKDYFSIDGKTIIRKYIILSLLNTSEIIIWYYGDWARVYLFVESGLSIWFLYEYITPYFSHKVLPHLRHKKVINFMRYPTFFLFIISFIANIFGYVNLTVFLQQLLIQAAVIIFLTIGMWNIVMSFIMLLIDYLSRYEGMRLKEYLPLLKKRVTLLFQLYFTYILFNAFLSLFEMKSVFYNAFFEFFSSDVQLGTITFTFGNIALFIIILMIAWGLNSLIKIIFDEENYRSYGSVRGIPSAISMTFRILITTAAIMFAFSAAGFDMQNLSIIVGALGVGIGFGLQNIVNDYISGLILIYERPVQKGDTVEVNNLMGEVVDIGIRRSNMRTFDGAEIIIPNAHLTSNQLTNWTLSDKQKRLDIRIGVSYGSDPNFIIHVMKKVAEENPMVLQIPAPRVLFNEFGDSSLNFRLLCWVMLENGIQAKSDISVSIFNAFAENGIEIPFPQVDLHIKDTTLQGKEELPKKRKPKFKAKKTENKGETLMGSDGGDGDD
jgi:small-conductance mechanosensitive channel